LEIEISCSQWEGSACTQSALIYFLLSFGWVGGTFAFLGDASRGYICPEKMSNVNPESPIFSEGSISIMFRTCPKTPGGFYHGTSVGAGPSGWVTESPHPGLNKQI